VADYLKHAPPHMCYHARLNRQFYIEGCKCK